MKGKLFTLRNCKKMALANEAETRYNLKLTFKVRFQNAVTMYVFFAVNSIFQTRKNPILQDSNELVLDILLDKFSTIAVDSQSQFLRFTKFDTHLMLSIDMCIFC